MSFVRPSASFRPRHRARHHRRWRPGPRPRPSGGLRQRRRRGRRGLRRRRVANGSANSCCTTSCCSAARAPTSSSATSPTPSRYGTVGGITAYAIGTTSCNIGLVLAQLDLGTPRAPGHRPEHVPAEGRPLRADRPGLAQARLHRAARQPSARRACDPPGTGARLGVNCSDPYDVEPERQRRLASAPRRTSTPAPASSPIPTPGSASTGNAHLQAPQVHNTDLDPRSTRRALLRRRASTSPTTTPAAKNNRQQRLLPPRRGRGRRRLRPRRSTGHDAAAEGRASRPGRPPTHP